MKKRILLAALLVCGTVLAGAPAPTEYGEGVADGEFLPLSDLLADPELYVDKEIQVEGVIVDVCSRMGCWIEIASKDREDSIRLKVEDGVIVFPVEVKGKWTQARGKLRRMELSEERAIARAEHFAEEQGKTFDPETIKGPQTIYQLDGVGARVFKKKPKKS
jgi:hypothetical protein